eukprot:gene32787-55320_t
MTTLSELNSCDVPTFAERLHGIYEHSPWIPQRAAALRPFASVTALKQALQAEVAKATQEEQLGLIRAHPELAGKAAIAGELTAESTSEQAKSGLNLCSAEEFATLQENIGFVGLVMAAMMLLTLWLATRSVKIVAAIVVTIVAGLALTTAIGLAAIGTLNLISVAFIPLFVGLGVDFGIQISV